MSIEVELHVVSGPESFQSATFGVASEPAVIGRSSSSSLVLGDPSVSREHAALVMCHDGSLGVRDLGSTAGTTVNLVRVAEDETVTLSDRDMLGIGPWKMLARVTGAASVTYDADHEPPHHDEAAQTIAPQDDEHDTSRNDSIYATQASIFIRLRADGSTERELGWQQFAQKYSRVIAGFARNAGLRAQEADDVLQDVLLGFFRVSDAFEYDPNKGRFRGYLKRVTLNAIRGRHRRKRPDVGIEDWQEPALPEDLDDQWDRQWTEQLMARAFAEVREEVEECTWRAFELYGMRGTPAAAVAEETGMTEAAIRHAKMRLTKRLRAVVDRLREEEG